MSFQSIQSSNIEIPAKTSYWGYFKVKGNANPNLVSVGFQNLGFMTQVYPTQLFIFDTNQLFFQVDNLNSTSVQLIIHGVVASDEKASFGSIINSGSKEIG